MISFTASLTRLDGARGRRSFPFVALHKKTSVLKRKSFANVRGGLCPRWSRLFSGTRSVPNTAEICQRSDRLPGGRTHDRSRRLQLEKFTPSISAGQSTPVGSIAT